jgi:hypothetical protein
VNFYGYKPLGKWQATNFGDLETGLMYQISKTNNSGALVSMGFLAPTGKVDDADTLQDISFGDGQWDIFLEAGGGYTFSPIWSTDFWTRLTYQAPYKTTIRLPDSATFPVTTRKGVTEIKLGNKTQANLQENFKFNDQWMSSLTYIFEYKEEDKYKSAFLDANKILAMDTEKFSQSAKINLNYSTVKLYQQKKFAAPMNFNLSAQSIFSGKNTPNYERFDFELGLYF